MGRILLVRHGQASLLSEEYDRLSALGTEQSRATGAWLGPRLPAPQLVVSGALQRQRQTAAACAAAARWRVDLGVDARFDESSHHELFAQAHPQLADPVVLAAHLRTSEHPRREFQALFARAFDGWLRGHVLGGGGLTWPQFRQRCVDALQPVVDACGGGQSAVIVTSGGPIAAICQHVIGLPDERAANLHTPLYNASITQLLTRPGELSLSFFNSVAHLELQTGGESMVTYR